MVSARKPVTTSPENSETPLEAVRSWVTPTRLFFVRNHFQVPEIDPEQWRLTVSGCIRKPCEFTLEQLSEFPQRSVLATIECAGNGRSFLQPAQHGVPWGAGAIAHAEWSGVPLCLVLERAGIEPGAVEVVFEGADSGTESDHPEPMHFARGLPLAKALHPDTLLATHMNGEPLEPSHGFPVRLLVPGWYGVASIKWLTRIDVATQPFRGYFQTKKYTVQRRRQDSTETVPIQAMAIKSEILRPQAGESLAIGTQRVSGLAWAGEELVSRVEVSVDGGESWREATLLGPHAPYSWTLWEYLWEVAEPGEHSLLARAVSASGQVQPDEHESLDGAYMIRFSRPREVRVAGGAADYASPAATIDAAAALLYDMNSFAEANSRLPLDVHLEFSLGAGI